MPHEMTGTTRGRASERVQLLLAAWNSRDLDAFAALLSPDVYWHDLGMPAPPAVGRDQTQRRARYKTNYQNLSSFMRRLSGAVVACVLLLSCTNSDADVVDGSSVIAFDTAAVHLTSGKDTLTIHAEVARSAEQKTMGLMERRSLADTAGMLFVYDGDQPANAGFWMFRTRIPLDIAFADSIGRIVAVRHMVPCEAQLAAGCPSYEPGQVYRVALEVNAGVLSRRGITVGSRLWTSALPSSLGAAREGA